MIKRQILFIWIIILSPFLSLFFLVQLASFEFFGPLPSLQQLEDPKSNLATEIISEDGKVLGKYFFENRTKVKFDEISDNLINAPSSSLTLVVILWAKNSKIFSEIFVVNFSDFA